VARLDDNDAIRALDEVRSFLIAEGKSDLVEKLADVVTTLRPPLPRPGDLLSTGEAAAILGIRSVNTIKRWASDGLLDGYRVGGRIKVTPESVDKLQTSPIAQRQRRCETALGASLAPFDGGDEPLPPTGSAHVGRKPWDAP
jgi:excisionase family DNA binding protein